MTPRTAQDYWRAIDEAWAAHIELHPDDPSGGKAVQDLCSEAVLSGVWKDFVDVGDGVKVRLQELIAPLRVREGGYRERADAESKRVLAAPAWRRRRWDRA